MRVSNILAVTIKFKRKNTPPKPHKARFTVDLQAMRSELDRDIAALQELQARIEKQRKKIAAAVLLAPDLPEEEPEKPKANRKPKPTEGALPSWTEAIMQVVNGKTQGMAHPDVLKEVVERFSLPLSKGAKGFYNAIKRLSDDGAVVKRGGLIYTPALVAALERSGQVLPVRQVDRGGSLSIVLGVLRDHPRGLSAPQVKELVGKHPDAPRSITQHKHYIYNVLGVLVQRGRIMRRSGIYKLAEQQAVQPALH